MDLVRIILAVVFYPVTALVIAVEEMNIRNRSPLKIYTFPTLCFIYIVGGTALVWLIATAWNGAFDWKWFVTFFGYGVLAVFAAVYFLLMPEIVMQEMHEREYEYVRG